MRQDVQQSAGDGGEAAGLGEHRRQASREQIKGIVERIIHHPNAGSAGGQGGEALGLFFELEQGGLVEGRSSGKITGRDGIVEQAEELGIVLRSKGRVVPLPKKYPIILAACSYEYILIVKVNPGESLLTGGRPYEENMSI